MVSCCYNWYLDNIQVVVGGVNFGDQYTNSLMAENRFFYSAKYYFYRINGNTGSTTPVLQK